MTSFTNTFKIAFQEVRTTDFEAFLDNFGGELIHAVLGGVAKHMIDGAATVLWSTVFADVLDAPIAKLPVGYNVDVVEDLIDAGTLLRVSKRAKARRSLGS